MVGVVEEEVVEVVGVNRGVVMVVEAGRRLVRWMIFGGRSVRAVDEVWRSYGSCS